jgi:hypothetical protein
MTRTFYAECDADTGRAKIFESPDGGRTVYVREAGEVDRQLYSSNPDNRWGAVDSEKWRRIVSAGTDDPVLQDLLDRVIVYYNLSKKDGT